MTLDDALSLSHASRLGITFLGRALMKRQKGRNILRRPDARCCLSLSRRRRHALSRLATSAIPAIAIVSIFFFSPTPMSCIHTSLSVVEAHERWRRAGKKKEFMERGGSISAWAKCVDCVTRGEQNLCTMLGGLGFTALVFLGFFRATGRLSGQRGRTRGADEGRLRAQRAVGQTCNSHGWPCCCSRWGRMHFAESCYGLSEL